MQRRMSGGPCGHAVVGQVDLRPRGRWVAHQAVCEGWKCRGALVLDVDRVDQGVMRPGGGRWGAGEARDVSCGSPGVITFEGKGNRGAFEEGEEKEEKEEEEMEAEEDTDERRREGKKGKILCTSIGGRKRRKCGERKEVGGGKGVLLQHVNRQHQVQCQWLAYRLAGPFRRAANVTWGCDWLQFP